VEEGLGATPKAGENAGRKLTHSNVVRMARVLPAASADAVLDIPPGLDPAKSRLVGLIQSEKTMHVFGAAQVALPGAGSARLSGRVVDRAGRGVAAVLVQACSGSACVPVVTDESGFFVMEAVVPGKYTLAAGAATAVREVELAAGQDVALRLPAAVTH
jgi:hypothetical protein